MKSKTGLSRKKIVITGICMLIVFVILSFLGLHTYLKQHNTILLTQLQPNSKNQMMGYFMKTKNGKSIVIDGGMKEDASNLLKYLKENNNHVDFWFLTHPHNDHVGAFIDIVNHHPEITISKIGVALNSLEWIQQYEPRRYPNAVSLYEALDKVKNNVRTMKRNDIIKVDNATFEILGVNNSDITKNSGNNSSMIIKTYVGDTTLLFLGDTGIESEEKLLMNTPSEKLKSDYVQMAHHGQGGVDEKLYKIIDPKVCLWPTTDWLWDCDKGSGKGSGPWKTLETRKWIEDMGVTENYIAKDGDVTLKIGG